VTNDGACNLLVGSPQHAIKLRAASGSIVDISTLAGTTVLVVYPRIDAADGFWDLQAELLGLGVALFAISTAMPLELRAAAARLKPPFELLSDFQLELTHGWGLPTFVDNGEVRLKRFTLVLRGGQIAKVFYPVASPGTNASDVLAWLKEEAPTPARS
jgi:peroxiredoxin